MQDPTPELEMTLTHYANNPKGIKQFLQFNIYSDRQILDILADEKVIAFIKTPNSLLRFKWLHSAGRHFAQQPGPKIVATTWEIVPPLMIVPTAAFLDSRRELGDAFKKLKAEGHSVITGNYAHERIEFESESLFPEVEYPNIEHIDIF